MQFKSCFTYQFLIKLLAHWQCLFARQSQILPMICAWWVFWTLCEAAILVHSAGPNRNRVWRVLILSPACNHAHEMTSTLRSLLTQVPSSDRTPGCFPQVWKQPDGRTMCVAVQVGPTIREAGVCLCVYYVFAVCVFAFLLFPGLCPQACDLLAHAWFIHFKSFNLMGYILSKHCLINCGALCFSFNLLYCQGGTRINTQTEELALRETTEMNARFVLRCAVGQKTISDVLIYSCRWSGGSWWIASEIVTLGELWACLLVLVEIFSSFTTCWQ